MFTCCGWSKYVCINFSCASNVLHLFVIISQCMLISTSKIIGRYFSMQDKPHQITKQTGTGCQYLILIHFCNFHAVTSNGDQVGQIKTKHQLSAHRKTHMEVLSQLSGLLPWRQTAHKSVFAVLQPLFNQSTREC